MQAYSVAIRTLGTSGEKFVRELKSIFSQSVLPEKVVIYIAEGHKRPDFTIADEQYVYVKKGMVAQRVLKYDEIDTPLVLMLDDDVELAPDSAERLITALENHNADCVAADTFKNHEMSLATKIYAAMTNLVFPHSSSKWAFKIHCNGSFSYNNNPNKSYYLSQSAAGPASLWRKETFLKLKYEDELWLDEMGFAYGDDAVIFNKIYKNGYQLGILYDSGIKNLDARSSSSSFQRNLKKFQVRSMATCLIWYRTCYNLKAKTLAYKICAFTAFAFKSVWLLIINVIASIRFGSIKVVWYYLKGYLEAYKTIKSKEFKDKENYIL